MSITERNLADGAVIRQAPRTPEMETLRDALAVWDDSPKYTDRHGRNLAEAARSLVTLYDTQLARYDDHMASTYCQILAADAEEGVRRTPPVSGGVLAERGRYIMPAPSEDEGGDGEHPSD